MKIPKTKKKSEGQGDAKNEMTPKGVNKYRPMFQKLDYTEKPGFPNLVNKLPFQGRNNARTSSREVFPSLNTVWKYI